MYWFCLPQSPGLVTTLHCKAQYLPSSWIVDRILVILSFLGASYRCSSHQRVSKRGARGTHQSFLRKGYLKLPCDTFDYISLFQTLSTSYIISKMSGRKYIIYAELVIAFLLKTKKKSQFF